MIKKLICFQCFSMLIFCLSACALTNGKTYDFKDITKVKTVTDYKPDAIVEQMETIKFGSYPQSDKSGAKKEPIEWLVLKKENNKAFLLSKYILYCKCYNENEIDVTWETCTLRHWLNNEFYHDAFNNNEQNQILTTNVVNDNIVGETIMGKMVEVNAGNDTLDKVFCLSRDEVIEYFFQNNYINDENKLLATKGTNYAKSIYNNGYNLFVYDSIDWFGKNSPFMLRSPGSTQKVYSQITASGHLDTSGDYVNGFAWDNKSISCGVRPAIWVSY